MWVIRVRVIWRSSTKCFKKQYKHTTILNFIYIILIHICIKSINFEYRKHECVHKPFSIYLKPPAYIHYVDQRMHWIKCNKNTNHTLQFMIIINSCIFRHWSAILRYSIWTKGHKSSTLIQILVALTVIIKILKYSNFNVKILKH
jgi:hypothetical protein